MWAGTLSISSPTEHLSPLGQRAWEGVGVAPKPSITEETGFVTLVNARGAILREFTLRYRSNQIKSNQMVAIQPARASPLARYAPAITIGCFVVEVENPRPKIRTQSGGSLTSVLINEGLSRGVVDINILPRPRNCNLA